MKSSFLGIDVGGTKIFGGRYSASWEKMAENLLPTESKNGKEFVLNQISKVISALIAPEVKTIGIAWAGFVDSKQGKIIFAPNIPDFENVPLAEILHEKFHLPVFLENDARLFTLAESRIGLGKGIPNILGITFGTGIGSGIIIENKMYRGHNGFAGEIGHTFFGTQRKSEAEDMFSGRGLKNRFHQENMSEVLEEHFESWKKQKGKGFEIYEKMLEELAEWLRNLILTFNPGRIIFGGGIGTQIFPQFLPSLQLKVEKELEKIPVHFSVDIVISELENSGALGATIFAMEAVSGKR